MTFLEQQSRRWRRLDRVVRLIIVNWALGMAVGATLALGMLAFDVFGLRTLLWRSDIALAGTVLFVGMFALSFGGVVAATAAMRAGRDDDDEPRGGRRAPAPAYVAARGAR
ncbi:MAG: hypothetical protein KGM15_00325 [Pseudomonadota bacterium]|nr:hypothetical protein [Pseudomonadota bacterium]